MSNIEIVITCIGVALVVVCFVFAICFCALDCRNEKQKQDIENLKKQIARLEDECKRLDGELMLHQNHIAGNMR